MPPNYAIIEQTFLSVANAYEINKIAGIMHRSGICYNEPKAMIIGLLVERLNKLSLRDIAAILSSQRVSRHYRHHLGYLNDMGYRDIYLKIKQQLENDRRIKR